MEIAHLGVVVADLDEAIRLWCDGLGGSLKWRKTYLPENAEIALVKVGDLPVELLQPTGEGALSKFLEKRGGGMHHLAFRSQDPSTLEREIVDAGGIVLEETRQDGAEGKGALFFHPKSTGGILMEITG
ncbi:VOC family protein [bacterium]|nr:VOC family protein [bacterium]